MQEGSLLRTFHQNSKQQRRCWKTIHYKFQQAKFRMLATKKLKSAKPVRMFCAKKAELFVNLIIQWIHFPKRNDLENTKTLTCHRKSWVNNKRNTWNKLTVPRPKNLKNQKWSRTKNFQCEWSDFWKRKLYFEQNSIWLIFSVFYSQIEQNWFEVIQVHERCQSIMSKVFYHCKVNMFKYNHDPYPSLNPDLSVEWI